MIHFYPGNGGFDSPPPIPQIAWNDLKALGQGVYQEPGTDLFHFLPFQISLQEVLNGCICLFLFFQFKAQPQFNGLAGRLTHIVRNTWPKTHLDKPIERLSQGSIDGIRLSDGIGKGPAGHHFQLFRGKVGIDGIDRDGIDGLDLKVQVLPNPPLELFPKGIADMAFQADFNAMGHSCPPPAEVFEK